MKKLLPFLFSLIITTVVAQTKLEPTETEALLNVSVVNGNNKTQEGEKVTFVAQKTKKTYSGVTGADGKFSILIPEGDEYLVKYKSFSDDKDYNTIKVPSQDGLINFDFSIKVELPKTYTLDNVFFDSGRSVIRPESFKELNELAEFMKLKKSLVIEIAGHTDNVGKADENMKLSQDRSAAVRDYLIRKGIAAERVTAKGYGATQPVADNTNDKGRQQNRRTEVRIVKE